MSLSLSRGLLMVIFFGTASLAYRYIISKKKKPLPINSEPLIIDAPSIMMQHHIYRPSLHPTTARFLYYLNLAHYSLDIYMEMITCLDMVSLLIDLYKRGVRLRIVVDPDMACAPASNVQLLEKQGVDVRFSTADATVKNFCLIDTLQNNKEPLRGPFVIFGVPPWSKEPLPGEDNEVVLTIAFVDVFKEEFERIYAVAI